MTYKNGKKYQKELVVPVFSAEGMTMFHTLLANLIYERPLIHLIGMDLRKLPLPSRFLFERNYIDGLYEFTTDEMPPTREALVAYLIEVKHIKDAESKVDQILMQRTHGHGKDPAKVLRNAYNTFLLWWKHAKREASLEMALEIARTPSYKTEEEKQREISTVLQSGMPVMNRTESYAGAEEEQSEYVRQQREVMARVKGGRSAFPMFPFAELNHAIHGLQKGDPCLFTARSGFGKSLIGEVVGEYMAYVGGFYVLKVDEETSVYAYAQRRLARHFGIPTGIHVAPITVVVDERHAYQVPQADPDHPLWENILSAEHMAAHIKRLNVAGGVFARERMPGASMVEIISKVAEHMQIAESMGLQFVAIVDYLQKIAWSMGGDEREVLTLISNQWKNFADSNGIYSMVFSQESDDTNAGGGKKGFGSSVSKMVFQQHLSLIRPDKDSIDEYVFSPDGGDRMLNAIGEPRLYATRKGPSGAKATIKVEKANNGRQGAEIPVVMEAPLFNIMCPHAIERGDSVWGLRDYTLLDENYLINL